MKQRATLHLSALGTLVVAVAAAGCKPDVPEAWKDLIPTENLERVIPLDGNETLGDLPGVMAWYDNKKVDVKKLRADYRERIEKAGYKLLVSCGDDKPYDAFVKDKGFMDFSAAPLTDETLDVRLKRTDKAMSYIEAPEQSECTWTAAADEVCETREGKRCTFKRGS